MLCCSTFLESRVMKYTFLCSVAYKLLDTVRVKVRTPILHGIHKLPIIELIYLSDFVTFLYFYILTLTMLQFDNSSRLKNFDWHSCRAWVYIKSKNYITWIYEFTFYNTFCKTPKFRSMYQTVRFLGLFSIIESFYYLPSFFYFVCEIWCQPSRMCLCNYR